MEGSVVSFQYTNAKNEVSDRQLLVVQDIKPVKPAVLGFDVSGMTVEEAVAVEAAYAAYQEKYCPKPPSFEDYVEEESLGIEVKWRRFIKENIEWNGAG